MVDKELAEQHYQQYHMKKRRDLAAGFTDLIEANFPCSEKEFLTLAKQAWRAWYEEATDIVIKPGPQSMKARCIEAIEAGYAALGLNPYDEPLPLGRLVKMICERVPDISKETAKKHARHWERTFEPRTHPGRMAQYRDIKHRLPALYKRPKR